MKNIQEITLPIDKTAAISTPPVTYPACFWHPRLLRSRNVKSAAGTGFGGLVRFHLYLNLRMTLSSETDSFVAVP